MKEKLIGNMTSTFHNRGFSTLELMIAFAIMSIILVASVEANFSAQYWSITGETGNEALYKARTRLEDLRSLVKQDFYQATSSPKAISIDPSDPADDSCRNGGLCYFVKSTVTDISPCSKYVEAEVSWQVQNYPTTTTRLFTNLTNSGEIINLAGDCVLNEPTGDWGNLSIVGGLSFTPGKQFTGIDVLHKKIYATSGTIPGFLVYDEPASIGQNPVQVGSYDVKVSGVSMKLNSLDVMEDLATGRTYAFVAVNSTTTQLAVLDVTDAHNPALVSQKGLGGITAPGTFSEGWRVFIYGQRLYMTTRETSGNEFHIFDISTPTLPIEIGNGVQINRTVNSIVVRDQKISGVTHRLVFLASDSDLKELGVFDVTNDVVSELNSFDLSGNQDGQSLFILGNNLYFGRSSDPTGPELYVFDVTNPGTTLPLLGRGEVGANVTNIKASANYLFAGTNRAGDELQVWNSDFTTWNPAVLNSGRFTSLSFPNLSPLGFDINGNWIYSISNLVVGDMLRVFYAP